ncbi:acylphosphatase [Pontibacillus marinus]|uniref:Acylphosphatase n=1 Tax=Pontibacillus marinus BH030004 = DSM 16465 TaxID=1385511 RepID=A0A0A5FWQ5_9BACI|nr:acylphosphatase [Pontibacillus marinus]KGX85231.1 acylphosphatase [Pontibacillus marinus BH030004 = DSM 16465]
MKHVHLTIHGRVQGVGFRFSAKQKAKEFNVNGWVQNNQTGTVEVEAEGEDKQIDAFVEALKHGPSPYAKVSNIDITKIDQIKGFDRFEIR